MLRRRNPPALPTGLVSGVVSGAEGVVAGAAVSVPGTAAIGGAAVTCDIGLGGGQSLPPGRAAVPAPAAVGTGLIPVPDAGANPLSHTSD